MMSCGAVQSGSYNQFTSLDVALLRFDDSSDTNSSHANINMLISKEDLLAIFNNYMKTSTKVDRKYYDINIESLNGMLYLRAMSDDEYISTTSLHLINAYDKGGIVLRPGKTTCTSRDCSDGSSCIPEGSECTSCNFLNDCVKTTTN